MTDLKIGDAAPDFDLPSDGVEGRVTLKTLRGRPFVLYFYPKDDTPGCTTEAKDFSCLIDDFEKAGVQVVGVSPDTSRSHAKFRDKHDLKVTLASDEDTEIARSYGVWVEKQMYGRTFMGVERATFLIDGAGKISQIWRNVRVAGHADEVLATVRSIK